MIQKIQLKAESWRTRAKAQILKLCSDTYLMVLFHGVLRVRSLLHNPLSKIVFPTYDILPSWCHPKLSLLLPKMSSKYDMLPKYHMKYPYINYLSFSSRIWCPCLSLVFNFSSRSSKWSRNIFFSSLGVKVSQFNQNMDHYF